MQLPELTDIRWEFRCWPPANAYSDLLAEVNPDQEPERETRIDIYLLHSTRRDELAKLRARTCLEVKRRLDVSGRIAQWGMAVRAGFPVEMDKLPETATLAPLTGQFETPLALVEAARARSSLSLFAVRKFRRLWRRDGFQSELTLAEFAGQRRYTIAFEADNPDDLTRHIAGFVRRGFDNLSYGDLLRGYREPMHA